MFSNFLYSLYFTFTVGYVQQQFKIPLLLDLNIEETQESSNKIIVLNEDIECDGESTKNYQTVGQDGQGGSEKQEDHSLSFKYHC